MNIQLIKHYQKTTDDRGDFYGIVHSGNWEEVNRVTSKSGAVRGNHYHQFTREIIFMISGKVKVQLTNAEDLSDRRSFILHAGEGILIPPMVIHSFYYLEDSIHIALLDRAFQPKSPDLHTSKLNAYDTSNTTLD